MSRRNWITYSLNSFCNRAPEWIVAITAIVAIIITLLQLRIAQRDTTEQLKLTKEALIHSKQSAEVSQRAWVLVTGVTFQEIVAEKPLWLKPSIKNVGASPAFDLRLSVNWRATTEPVPDKLEMVQPLFQSQAVLGPGEKTTSPIQTKSIPTKVLRQIQKGKGSLLLYGQITYRDPLSNDRRTIFRAVYNPETKTFQYASVGNTIE